MIICPFFSVTGTSACPAGKFYCRNLGSTPQFIFSSRVNDLVCGEYCSVLLDLNLSRLNLVPAQKYISIGLMWLYLGAWDGIPLCSNVIRFDLSD